MNERYIQINDRPTIIRCDFEGLENARSCSINDFILNYLRYEGGFAANLRPIEDSDVYPDGEYSEIRIIIRNTNEETEEPEDEEIY